MALCPSCGKNIDDSCSFCSACGAKIENVIVQNGAYNVSTREGTLALMNDVKTLYYGFSEQSSAILALETENEKLRNSRTKPPIIFLILAIACTIIGVVGGVSGSGILFFFYGSQYIQSPSWVYLFFFVKKLKRLA